MIKSQIPIILAIDTSCDETSVAVTQGTRILSNVVWSQASQHAKFGGVMPSLAKRIHEERIEWVIEQAVSKSQFQSYEKIDAVAVTSGPGLAIALEVGIRKAKELSSKLNIPLIEVNHIEGHLLSPLAESRNYKSQIPSSKHVLINKIEEVNFPAFGLVVSGGHTELVYIEEIGKYKIIAATLDDALGEALDKAARMLGLGYPGGAYLEKLAREGNSKRYPLPLPMAGRENKNMFSYSGLKTAFYRLNEQIRNTNDDLNKQTVCDLAASFQDMAFKHLIRVTMESINTSEYKNISSILVGGGVSANLELRKRLRNMGKELGIKVYSPKNKKLCGDNAGMIGIAAGFKSVDDIRYMKYDLVDRKPRWKVDED